MPARLQHQVLEVGGLAHVAEQAHRKFSGAGFDAAARHFDVLQPQRVLDVGHGQAVGGQPVAVDPQPHREARPVDAHRADAGHGLDARHDKALDHLDNLEAAVDLGIERQRHHRRLVGIGLGHARRVDALRQHHTADAVTHVVGGLVDIAIQIELDDDA